MAENNSGGFGPRYKFMINIYTPAMHTTRYYKALESITKDANVPTLRVVIALGLFAAAVITWGWLVFSDTSKILYTILPGIIGIAGSFIMIMLYLIPSRDKSMLSATGIYLMSRISETARRKQKRRGAFKSFGIRSFKNKVLFLEDGRYGIPIFVEGQRSNSVIPQVAMATAEARRSYYIARPETTEEILFTSIQEVNVETQLNNLMDYYEKADGNTDADAYRRFMANIYYNQIDKEMAGREYGVKQMVVLMDYDRTNLQNAYMRIRQAAANGLYTSFERIEEPEPLVNYLSNMLLLSKKGAKNSVKQSKKESQTITRG